MDLYTLRTFFRTRLAFFFICVSINLRYTQTVCADNGIILRAYSVNFNSCCYIDNVIFWWGAITEEFLVVVTLVGSLNYLIIYWEKTLSYMYRH